MIYILNILNDILTNEPDMISLIKDKFENKKLNILFLLIILYL